jgi:hypothetical protein
MAARPVIFARDEDTWAAATAGDTRVVLRVVRLDRVG